MKQENEKTLLTHFSKAVETLVFSVLLKLCLKKNCDFKCRCLDQRSNKDQNQGSKLNVYIEVVGNCGLKKCWGKKYHHILKGQSINLKNITNYFTNLSLSLCEML